jgi:hypothetical protein
MQIQRILALLAIAFLAGNLHAAQVTNVIDEFTTSQSIATNNASLTNTVAASNAIGGFRTMGLTTAGGNTNESTSIFVSAGSQRLTLNTPVESSADFQLKWGGANGNAGLGADFGAGQPLDLFTSILSFALRGTDLTSNFTWQFTDIGGNTASYAGSFSPHSSTNPALLYNISLDLFANAGAVNWNAINYIIFSGGGVEDLDMTINAPFKVVASTVPEPGTWALAASGILTLIAATHRRFRRCR